MLVLAKGGSLITPSCATSDTSGWSTGNTIVLAFALAAAGALAYLFSGGTAAWQRHERQPVAAVAVRPRETRDAAADAAPADELSWIAWAYAALASFPCCMPSSFSRTAQGHTGCSLPSLSLPCCRDRGTGARLHAAARAERSGGRPLIGLARSSGRTCGDAAFPSERLGLELDRQRAGRVCARRAVLALILIFWLFASPPAQASAGTNFSASPLMQ